MRKPKIRYFLKSKNKEVECRLKEELIEAEINAGFIKSNIGRIKYDRCIISLETNIKPKNFGRIENNFKYDEIIFSKYSKSNLGIKTKINLFEIAVDKTYNHFLINKLNPSAEEFKSELFIHLDRNKREVKKEIFILEYLEDTIKKFEGLKGSGRENEITESSIKIYRTIKIYLEIYEYFKNSKLTFLNFDEIKYWEIWEVNDNVLKGNLILPEGFLKRKKAINKYGFLKNSISKYQKEFIHLIKLAVNEKIETSFDYTKSGLILKRDITKKNYYIDELTLCKIQNYSTENPVMQKAKDYVILASLTGMRNESMTIAHLEKIQKIKDFYFLHSRQNKTKTECYIPLMKPVLDILKKYNNQFPQFPVNYVLNKQIKHLFKMAEINEKIDVVYDTYKSGVINKKENLCDLVSTHDFRKSFFTNLKLLDIPTEIIMNITHPDKKTKFAMAAVYDKSTLLDNANKLYKRVVKMNKKSDTELYRF